MHTIRTWYKFDNITVLEINIKGVKSAKGNLCDSIQTARQLFELPLAHHVVSQRS